MAQARGSGKGGAKKTIGRRPKAVRRAAPPEEPKKAPPPPEPQGPATGPASSWSDTFDRAAKKLGDFVERASPKAKEAAKDAAQAGKRMAVDLSGGLDDAFKGISEQAKQMMEKGTHTKVRIKFRDRQIAELPIAVVAAAEVASLWWFGPLRLLLGHVVGKAVLDVEFVSNADAVVAEGRALLADGELERAMVLFDKALAMDRRCAGAHLGRGIALKLKGDKAGARAAFEKAEECDKAGEVGREARRHLDNLG